MTTLMSQRATSDRRRGVHVHAVSPGIANTSTAQWCLGAEDADERFGNSLCLEAEAADV